MADPLALFAARAGAAFAVFAFVVFADGSFILSFDFAFDTALAAEEAALVADDAFEADDAAFAAVDPALAAEGSREGLRFAMATCLSETITLASVA